MEPGNFLLRNYVAEEISLLSTLVGYKQFESSPTTIGGNPAHKIVYSYSSVRNGVEVGQVKAMLRHILLNMPLPLAQKMIDSFQFTSCLSSTPMD